MQSATSKVIRFVTFAFGALAFVASPTRVVADAPPEAQAVLAQEHRWLRALSDGDQAALAALLPDNFVHITYQGRVRNREQELDAVTHRQQYTEYLSEQTVDFTQNIAIVHGLNTVSQLEKTVLELRYTDVYTKDHGVWRPICAQETAVAEPTD